MTSDPSQMLSFPVVWNMMPVSRSKKITSTSFDWMANLHITSLTSCADNGFLTLMRLNSPLHKLSRHGVLRVGVIVEALARLAAVPAGQHQALQQRRRGKAPLLELVVHDVRDVVPVSYTHL